VLAHLSDLHFGRIEPAALQALRRRVAELAPDLVVVSGDLTQRARARQFRAARAFLDSLPGPRVVVPGNHDVPLFNVFARFLAPLAGYRRLIAHELDPRFVDEEIAVLGLNTARSLTWKEGAVSDAQLALVREKLCRIEGEVTKVLVTHHPFMFPERLRHCGVDLLLAGHLHASRAGHAEHGMLVVQAGTATSSRTRDGPNAFNVLRIERGWIELEQHVLRDGAFVHAARQVFCRGNGGWRPHSYDACSALSTGAP
jgi:3',5'-cyclic AMP phosphodiesterase CpdA